MAKLVLLALCLPGLALGVDLEPGASSVQGGMPDTNDMLWNGARWGRVQMVKDALAAGAFVDEREPECASALFCLLCCCSGTDQRILRAVQQTALHIAAKMGELNVVQFLLDERANVNARTHHDETPLMEATDHGHQKVAELLIKFEADVNARTVSGKTALHGAHMPPR